MITLENFDPNSTQIPVLTRFFIIYFGFTYIIQKVHALKRPVYGWESKNPSF